MVPVSVDTMHRTIALDVRPMRLYYRMSNNSGKMSIGTTVGKWAMGGATEQQTARRSEFARKTRKIN